jgi:general secretion pathway protein L
MSVLVVLIPPWPRPRSRDAAPPPVPAEWSWVLVGDGGGAATHGRGGPADWPRADRVVAVLAPEDVAWHLATVPKAPAARMRQALAGVLEDRLLDDDGDWHFALAPEAAAGQPGWIAVMRRAWIAEVLQRLQAAGRPADRLVPSLVPGVPAGHFEPDPDATDGRPRLRLSDAAGAMVLGLAGSLARARVAAAGEARWTATASVAAAAEAWLGHAVAVQSEAELAQQAARGPWNLLQFEFAPRHRGATALREGWRRFLAPAWRPVHVGLAALLLINLVGLNALAWTQKRALTEKKQAMVALLQSTHPQVRAVIDAPRQMARENELLRAAAGQPGDSDLETLLGVAAAAWPDDEAPVESLQFEPGRLVLSIDGWDEARVAEFRARVRPAGWSVAVDGAKLVLTRGEP